MAIALYPEVTEAEVEAVEAEVEAETGEPDVVSESAESGVPVQVLEAEESPATHGGSESAERRGRERRPGRRRLDRLSPG